MNIDMFAPMRLGNFFENLNLKNYTVKYFTAVEGVLIKNYVQIFKRWNKFSVSYSKVVPCLGSIISYLKKIQIVIIL